MVTMASINEMCRQHNAAGEERQAIDAMRAGYVLRSIGLTPAELAVYQDRVAGIGERLAARLAKMRNPPRLFR